MASIFLLGVSHEGTGQLTLVTCLQPFKRPNDDSMTQDPPLINHRISIDSLAFGGPGSYVSKDIPLQEASSFLCHLQHLHFLQPAELVLGLTIPQMLRDQPGSEQFLILKG